MSFAVTKTYADTTDLTEAQLDSAFQSIETLVNTTGLGTANLQAGAVDSTILASNAVTTAKIAAANVTYAKLAADITALLVPTGAIQAYGGSAAPTGWLVCDGSSVSRSTYSALFGVIGTKYGTADGTTFNLPDTRGYFLRGYDNGAGNDPDASSRTAAATGGATGDNIGTIQADGNKSHNHTITDPGHTHNINYSGNLGTGAQAGPNIALTGLTVATVSAVTGISLATSGGNETRPKNLAVNYIIKT